MPEVQAAIKAEIFKYQSFQAFKEVDNIGQKCIPTRWVVTEQSSSGKNEVTWKEEKRLSGQIFQLHQRRLLNLH